MQKVVIVGLLPWQLRRLKVECVFSVECWLLVEMWGEVRRMLQRRLRMELRLTVQLTLLLLELLLSEWHLVQLELWGWGRKESLWLCGSGLRR